MRDGATQIRIDCDITGLSIDAAFDTLKTACTMHCTHGITVMESIYFYEEEVRYMPHQHKKTGGKNHDTHQ